MTLHSLLYTSRARVPMNRSSVEAMAHQASARNAVCQVTGILIYSAGHFIQLLEGRRQTVESLYQRIARDPRHTEVAQILARPAPHRLFDRWNMGLLNLETEATLNTPRIQNLVTSLQGSEGPTPDGAPLLAALRDFREQLPAPSPARPSDPAVDLAASDRASA